MTAVVGILNKKAVAIAADSAATINNKIYNKALKIFTLSKYCPVGVMIYNSDSFMGIPLETIIKIYRQQLGENSFDTIAEYRDDFINFLKQGDFFMTPQQQIQYVANNVIYLLLNHLSIEYNKKPVPNLHNFFIANVEDLKRRFFVSANMVDEFNTYARDVFDADFEDIINNFLQQLFNDNGIVIGENSITLLHDFLYEIIIHKEQLTIHSGIVFTGFGESEIYPSLHSMILHFGFGNKLKHYNDRSVQITHEMGSSIQPFAQTDAMSTILVGIAPDLENMYAENFKQFLQKYNTVLVNDLTPVVPNIAAIIGGIDLNAIANEFHQSIQDAKQNNYINKLMDAVASLAKEDLAEMAESLIYLTYLQKRITFAQEDVGGAVDVAIISKGDGFIWIKRKHYFDIALNQHFLDNYYNE